jgi:hypothetical protein
MTRWIRVISIAVPCVVASVAWAGDIFTPVLLAGSNSASDVSCDVLNTGNGKVDDVVISIVFGGNGLVLTSSTFSIPAGAERGLLLSSLAGSSDLYCRVSGISKTKAKVTFCARDAGGNCTVVVTSP